jgi:hypothetical protein
MSRVLLSPSQKQIVSSACQLLRRSSFLNLLCLFEFLFSFGEIASFPIYILDVVYVCFPFPKGSVLKG